MNSFASLSAVTKRYFKRTTLIKITSRNFLNYENKTTRERFIFKLMHLKIHPFTQ